jgi:ribose/xylose/arabinose/galactoside ABC-type transport system permease subunit
MRTIVKQPLLQEGREVARRRNLWSVLGQYGIQGVLVVLLVVLGLINSNFRQVSNLQSILTQASFAGIGAIGMTLIIIAGAFDLSVAGILALCATAVAKIMPVAGVAPAILAGLLLGVALGIVNGVVVTKARIPAFITTLGMMYIYQAIDLMWTNGQVISISNRRYQFLGTGTILGVPVPFVVMIGAYLVGFAILKFTTYGRYLRAIGSNETAARVVGIPADRMLVFAFALVGLFTAVAGVLLAAELSSANATMATGFELNTIAVVVVGGTSLAGGQGTLFGSLTGALIFAVIYNAMDLFNVQSFWQYVAIGVVLILALGSESTRKRLLGTPTRT